MKSRATVRVSFSDIWSIVCKSVTRITRNENGQYAVQVLSLGEITVATNSASVDSSPEKTGWQDQAVFEKDGEAEAFIEHYGFVEEEPGIWARPEREKSESEKRREDWRFREMLRTGGRPEQIGWDP